MSASYPSRWPVSSFFYPVWRKFNFFFLPLCWALYVKRLLPCCCCWPAGAELKGPCVGSPQYSLWRPTRLLFGINNRSSPERPTGRSVSPCTCSVKRASLSVWGLLFFSFFFRVSRLDSLTGGASVGLASAVLASVAHAPVIGRNRRQVSVRHCRWGERRERIFLPQVCSPATGRENSFPPSEGQSATWRKF